MTTLTCIKEAVERTGFSPDVIEYLYDEFIEETNDEDFFEYLADQVGGAAFIIAASDEASIGNCLAAYDAGFRSVVDETFDAQAEAELLAAEEDLYLVDGGELTKED
jgi:hypothetical protein